MARSNRTQRRQNIAETGETSGNAPARDAAGQAEAPIMANAGLAGVDVGAAAAAAPRAAAQIGLDAVLMMLAQVLERLPVVAPVPEVPPQVVPPVVPGIEQVIEVNPRIPSYLKVLDHMQKLGTRFFSGGSKPDEADEWKDRLERNFESIRCPDHYKKDIAVHYLEGDAHTWWKGVYARLGNLNCTWGTFMQEFKVKFFPQEALDRMEGAFLDLRQGTKTVREYEAEFNRLKKYAGRELEDESVQVRRFMRGMSNELRIRCLLRDFGTVAELVEKAALIEAGMGTEKKVFGNEFQTGSMIRNKMNNGAGFKKKPWTKGGGPSRPFNERKVCRMCGKTHFGSCRMGSGACLRCGSKNHQVRDCPEVDPRAQVEGPRLCYNCGEPGHFKMHCPKLVLSAGKRTSEGSAMAPPPKRQAVTPRVYSVSENVASDPSSSHPITG